MNPNDTRLEPGTELELSYDGSRGSRTVTVYVLDHDVTENILDEDEHDHELIAAEPGARRPRLVRVLMSGTESADLLEAVETERYGLVKSLNSKSDRGRRLGGLEGLRATGAVDDRFVYGAAVRSAETGDVLRVDGDRGVVVSDGFYTTVEFDDGETVDLRTAASLGAYRRTDDYDRVEAVVEATGETVEPPAAAREAFEALQSYGHGDDEKVEAVEVDGERHEVVYRHDAEAEGIRLGDASAYDHTRLRLDPLGLTLDGERVDAEDVTLVFEDDDEDDEDADDEQGDESEDAEAEGDAGELVADGGEDDAPAFEVGDAVADATDDEPGRMIVLDPDAGRAGEVMVGSTGVSVADYDGNERVDDDERVVTCVFESWLDSNAAAWSTADEPVDEWLDAYASEWGIPVRTYDYPESRLTAAQADEDDGPTDPSGEDADDEQGDESGDESDETPRRMADLRESAVGTYDLPPSLAAEAEATAESFREFLDAERERPEDDDEDVATDGGAPPGGWLVVTSAAAAGRLARPLPAFDEFDVTEGAILDLVREQVARVVEAAREVAP